MVENTSGRPSTQLDSALFLYNLIAIFRNPLGIIRRRWHWMILAAVLGGAATTAIYSLQSPRYEAVATVLVSSQQIPEEFVRSTVSDLDSSAEINSLLAEAFSQSVLLKLIAEYGLYPDSRGEQDPAAIALMMRDAIMAGPQEAPGGRRGGGDSAVVIRIGYSAPDPEVAAGVTNSLAGSFINTSIENRSVQARNTTRFLRTRLEEAERQMDEVNLQLSAFVKAHAGEMPEDQQPLLGKIERLESQRSNLREEIADTKEQLIQLKNSEGVQSSPEAVLAGLRLELAGELALHTEEHPNVIALRRRITVLEENVGDVKHLLSQSDKSSEYMATAARRELSTLEASLAETDTMIEELDAQIARIPDNKEKHRLLEEQGSVLRDNYLDFLRKVQDAELAETLESAQQGPKASILDAALPPAEPTNSPRKYLVLGLLASLMLAAGVGVLVELMDPVVLSRDQLEAIGGPPFLGAVGRIG